MDRNLNTGEYPAGSILKEYKERVGFFHENVLDESPPEFKVTERTKEFAGKCRGSVRMRAGLFYTEKEMGAERKKLLSVK